MKHHLLKSYKEAEREIIRYANVSLHEQYWAVNNLMIILNRVTASRNQVPFLFCRLKV